MSPSNARLLACVSLAILVAELLLALYFQKSTLRPRLPEFTRAERFDQKSLRSWAVDPTATGENLPPSGASLFDALVARGTEGSAHPDIPFPFSALLGQLARAAGCDVGNGTTSATACFRAVLIPLGRSVQRDAAAPEYYKYPRIVVAFDAEPAHVDSPFAKDRLYLGYQEKTGTIEVISYNEFAGRFEFQLIRNYRSGSNPSVLYANRAICLSCHQNHGPIFSRATWDETNANATIAGRLRRERADFHGVRPQADTAAANAIEQSIQRANLLSAYQALWREACGADSNPETRCRAQAVKAALQFRLSRGREFNRESPAFRDFEHTFARNWERRWPRGLMIPNPEIPNRDPVEETASTAPDISAARDPLQPRGYLEKWQLETDRYRLIQGIADAFSPADMIALERLGSSRVEQAIDTLTRETEAGTLDLFGNGTFRPSALKAALFAHLGVSKASFCCANGGKDGDAAESSVNFEEEPRPAKMLFYRYCARCHAGEESFPPNFLHGEAQRVESSLKHCAQRIYYRLSMWRLPAEKRLKTPMPPQLALADFDTESWQADALPALKEQAAAMVMGDRGDAAGLAKKRYQDLPRCLPASPD